MFRKPFHFPFFALVFVLCCLKMCFQNKTVEGEHFRGMVHALNDNARPPDRQEILTTMRTVKRKLLAKIELLLGGEHVTITTDSWASHTGDAYVSVSISLIAKNWKRVSLMLDCAKFSSSKFPGSEVSGSPYPGLAAAAAAAAEEEDLSLIHI